jgi:hypothetical protein
VNQGAPLALTALLIAVAAGAVVLSRPDLAEADS